MDKLTTLIFDIVIAVMIAFVVVLIYFGLRFETVICTMDNEITETFLSELKEKGSMKTADYENYMYKLSLTGVLYDVLLEHRFSILEPEYRMRTIEEIITAQKAAFTGDNIYHYKDVITSTPVVTDPINNDGLTMNTETNESILAGAVNTPSSGHVHTDDCYLGHKHRGSTTFTHNHAHSGSCIQYTRSIYFNVTCHSCGRIYDWDIVTNYWHPTNGVTLGNSWGGAGLSNCITCGSASVTYGASLTEPGYSCGYRIDENGDRWGDTVANGVYKNYIGYSYPQSVARADYASGCYSYHNVRMFPRDASGFAYNGWDLTYDYQTKFCDIPSSYRLGFTISFMGESTNYYINYNGSLQTDGTVLLTRGYLYSDVQRFAGFTPVTITLSDMIAIGFDLRYWNNYKLYESAIRDASFSMLQPSLSGSIVLCNHTAETANKWFTTCGLVENATLICPDKVISIVSTNASQSVYTNEALITTVRATYQDGSTRIVLANTPFTTGSPVLNKTVTLSYTDTLGNVNTCSIAVNVVPRIKVCSNGHTYNLNTDGSDPGCVFCHAYVGSIRTLVPSVSTMTITIDTTLQDNGVKLLITYMDGHTETITEGYEDNLDKHYLGTKMVTIGYKGATTQILVTTVCAKLTCDICGFVYELYPDGTNPGCPRCISKTPVFTGNVLHYDSVNYTEDILEKLYQDGIYRFNKEDMLAVTVENKSSSLVRNLLGKIYPNMTDRWLHLERSETIRTK